MTRWARSQIKEHTDGEGTDKRVEGYTKVVLHPSTEVPRLLDEATAARGS